MKSETEVIFQPDGTILLQADGGWSKSYNTAPAAAWDAVRSIRGSDPDYGWAGNDVSARVNTDDSSFRREYLKIQESEQQTVWVPLTMTPAAGKALEVFSDTHKLLMSLPVPLLVACEKGNTNVINVLVPTLSPDAVSPLLKTVYATEMPMKTQMAIAMLAGRSSSPPIKAGIER